MENIKIQWIHCDWREALLQLNVVFSHMITFWRSRLMLEKIKLWKNKPSSELSDRITTIKNQSVPGHIAIIMDGNGRWAKKRALPRVAGHHEGMKVVRKITKLANQLGVSTLTLYAFSTENWKRPKMEVDYLMKLPEEFLGTFLPELIEENVQVRMIGYKESLPAHTLNAINRAIDDTKDNDGLVLNFALNYGSRAEILEAVKNVLKDHKSGILTENNINEEVFSNYLMTSELNDPDLLIRTSGEIRLSNFMLWQLAYTEFWFTDVLWPDFSEEHLVEAIEVFQNRQRRFGGV
jgi:undecaprenyl diphosphate synthase